MVRGTVNILFVLVLRTLESAPWVPMGSPAVVFPALTVVLGESVRTVSSFCHLLTVQAVPTSPLGGNLSRWSRVRCVWGRAAGSPPVRERALVPAYSSAFLPV